MRDPLDAIPEWLLWVFGIVVTVAVIVVWWLVL